MICDLPWNWDVYGTGDGGTNFIGEAGMAGGAYPVPDISDAIGVSTQYPRVADSRQIGLSDRGAVGHDQGNEIQIVSHPR